VIRRARSELTISTLPAPRIVVIALSLCLQACASLSEGECRGEDWYKIGFDDGFDGGSSEKIETHREACARYGIEPDREQYEVGRRDGLVHYCTVNRGFDIGREGRPYGGGCPAGTESEFLRGHSLGRRFYDVDQELARIDNEMRAYRVQLDTPELDDAQVRGLHGRISDLEFERERLEAERRDLEWERRRL